MGQMRLEGGQNIGNTLCHDMGYSLMGMICPLSGCVRSPKAC